jgi:hypothetical protein
MGIEIGETLGKSFAYAKDGLVGQWVRWILLIIISAIPIINFIFTGYTLRVMKGIAPAPELEDYINLFITGLIAVIIGFIWFLPAIIIGMILVGGAIISGSLLDVSSNAAAIAGALVGLGIGAAVTALVFIIFSLVAIIGIIRYARTEKFGDAFAFSAILDTIKSIGWLNYFIAILVFEIIAFIVYLVLAMIPVIGWILMIIAVPFIGIWYARYVSLIYDSA